MKIFNRFIFLFTIITFVFLFLNKNIALAQTVHSTNSINELLGKLNSNRSGVGVDEKINLNIEIGNYYYKEKQIDNAIKYLGVASNGLMQEDNLDEANSVMFNILAISIEHKRYTTIIQYSLDLLDNLSELYTQTGDDIYLKNMVGIDYLVATTCNILGDRAYGESYFKVGNELEKKYYIDETSSVDYVKSNYYFYQEDYEQAEVYALSGMGKSTKEKSEMNYLNGIIYLARAQINQGKLDEAKKNLKIVSGKMQKLNSTLIESEYYYYNGRLNEDLKNYDLAIDNYLKSYKYTKGQKLYDINGKILYRLGNLYNKIGEYQESANYYQQYIVQEQVLSNSKEKINANIIINMHENDPQNILNEIKFKKSQSNNKILILLVIGVLILASIIGGAYYKKRKNIKRLNSELNRDSLTKAFNRRYTIAYIQKLEKKRKHFAIAMLDVDNYKMVNDTYGHIFGDKVLKRLVKTMNLIGGDKVLVCRYGGEEFLLVFEIEKMEYTANVAKRIVRGIESLEWEYGNVITASCGISEYNLSEKTYISLEKADAFLYKAKKNGKNRVEY